MLKFFYRYAINLRDGRRIEQKSPEANSGFKFNKSNPDFDQIKSFELIPEQVMMPHIVLSLNPSKKLIFYRKTVGSISAGSSSPNWEFHEYLIGWKKMVKGRAVKDVLYIFPGGLIEVSSEAAELEQTFIAQLNSKFRVFNSDKDLRVRSHLEISKND